MGLHAELATMYNALARQGGSLAAVCRQKRDQHLREVPAEFEREHRIATMLLDGASKTYHGPAIQENFIYRAR